MLNFKIYFWHKYNTIKKTKERQIYLIEKIIIYSQRNIKTIKIVIFKILKT